MYPKELAHRSVNMIFLASVQQGCLRPDPLPNKITIRRYYNEGLDVLSASDMYAALSERPVKGTSACVCSIRQEHKNVQVNKIDGFSKCHNFTFEEKGARVWKAFGVGPGKLILYDQLCNAHQGPTCSFNRRRVFRPSIQPLLLINNF